MKIIKFDEINSTNTYAKQNIENIEDKTVISADFQTNGHGRFDRSWVDLGTQNIYMTIVLKPSEQLCETHANLTQYLSVVLCRQLEEMGLKPQIKWPNDVLLNSKKVCGILAETVLRGGKLKGIALGIGVNLNAKLDEINTIDRPATSVNLELGKEINKEEFMQNLLENFFEQYDNFLVKGFVSIKKEYEEYSILQRTAHSPQLTISVFDKIKTGTFAGFDDDGTLLLLVTDGNIEKINMGEIV